VHFLIATPFTINRDNIKASFATVRFQTSSGATVREITVFDGRVERARTATAITYPEMTNHVLDIEGNPEVDNSIVVSLRVRFTRTSGNNYIRFS
ncbi:hypothetical protein DL98DRAFT_441462, partial [Cadophora sp. DSE1049]